MLLTSSPTCKVRDLIEPYWNVKKNIQIDTYLSKPDLIEPYWNVKNDIIGFKLKYTQDLIEPYWNVKYF